MCQRRHLHLHLEAAACRVAALVLVAACLVAARSALLATGVESGPVPRRETAGTPHTQTVLGPEHAELTGGALFHDMAKRAKRKPFAAAVLR